MVELPSFNKKRSYKGDFKHTESIDIMKEMADNNKIDKDIVKDIDNYFGGKIKNE